MGKRRDVAGDEAAGGGKWRPATPWRPRATCTEEPEADGRVCIRVQETLLPLVFAFKNPSKIKSFPPLLVYEGD